MFQLSNKTNYLLTLFSSFGGTIITSIIGFISVPISLHYWQTEKFGVWILINSVLIYLGMSNLGLNAAAGTLMAKNPSVDDKLRILSRVLHILIITVGIFFTAFLLMNYFYTDWTMLLGKIPHHLKDEAHLTCFILAVFFFINLPFSLISSAFNGFHIVYIENICSVFLKIINFFVLLLVVYVKGNLVIFAIIMGSANLIFNLGKLGYLYFFVLKKMDYLKNEMVNIKSDNEDTSYRSICITGVRFFFTGIAGMVVWNTDYLVISNLLSVEKVTPYAITFTVYQTLFVIIIALNTSVLSILAKELGHNNWAWINKVYEKLLVIMAISGGLFWLGGVLFLKDLIYLWTGKNGYAGLLTVFALGGYSYLAAMANLNSGIINSFNYIKRMPFVGLLEAILKLSFSVLFIHFFDIGGVALGTFLASLISVSWILPIVLIKRSNYRLKYNIIFIVKHFTMTLFPLIILSITNQLFISNGIIRIVLGISIVFLYVFLSYKQLPDDTISFFDNLMTKLLVKLKIREDDLQEKPVLSVNLKY